MAKTLPTPAKAMLGIRSWFGVQGVLSPTPIARLSGFPEREMTTAARMFAAVFGVREFLMVALTTAAASEGEERLARLLRISAAVDGFDATAALLAAVGSRPMRLPGLLTMAGGVANCALCLAATRAIKA